MLCLCLLCIGTIARGQTSYEYVYWLDNDMASGRMSVTSGDSWQTDVDVACLSDGLHSLHIHDNDYRGDQHTIPFCGKIDWSRVTEALGEIDYDGDFTYEIGKVYLANLDEELIPAMLKYAEQVGRVLMKRIDEKRPKA